MGLHRAALSNPGARSATDAPSQPLGEGLPVAHRTRRGPLAERLLPFEQATFFLLEGEASGDLRLLALGTGLRPLVLAFPQPQFAVGQRMTPACRFGSERDAAGLVLPFAFS